jgi:hypothetical protein
MITKAIPGPDGSLISQPPSDVISICDGLLLGFDAERILRNSKIGECGLSPVFLEQTFVRSQSMVSRVVGGETLIVPVRGKVGDLASIYSFNGTGSLIWKLLETPRTISELAATVAQEYDVAVEQAAADVKQFVDEMLSAGLAEVPQAVAMAGD